MMLAGLVMDAGDWGGPLLATFAVALILSWWSYRRSELTGGLRNAGILLRALGATVLLFCLFEPLWTSQRARPGANWFAVVADNSQGMQIHDPGQVRSRGEELRGLLNDTAANWQDDLAAGFQVRRYQFDSRLQSVRDFRELDFNGTASALVTSLGAVQERFQGLPLAGALVFTDGNATDYFEDFTDFSGLPPIYPVVSGTDEPVRDLAITRAVTTQTAFEDAPITIVAEVTANGFRGQPVEAVVDRVPDGDQAGTNQFAGFHEQQILTPEADQSTLAYRFQIKAPGGSLQFYRLRVRTLATRQPGVADEPPPPDEATLVNNERLVMVDRGAGPYRILYLSGRPNWEFKFLNRALADDDQLRLEGLIRIARREPKFEFKGRSGETSNPLFRGFGNQDPDEVERYDQPVLIPLPLGNEKLRDGFPRTVEDLYAYHAVIVDDIEAEFFKPDQLAMLQKFVSERGGGFMMLGGQESFQEGGYNLTPVGNMLPVYLRSLPQLAGPAGGHGNLRLNLTREGWIQPWARVRSREGDEQSRLSALPSMQVLNTVSGVKPGASVVATVTAQNGTEHPALVVQRFGSGRTAAMLVGDFWMTGRRTEQQQEDQARAWRQLARWLVTDVPEQIKLTTRPDPAHAGAVQVAVRLKDKEFKPLDSASVKISVRKVADETSTNSTAALWLTGEPVPTEPGLFTASYVQQGSGGYLAEALILDEKGVEIGRARSGWVSEPAAEEFRSLSPNRALLEQIARQTGGEIVERSDLNEFVKKLPTKTAPVMESWSRPIWHNPWVFLIALACFVGEWGLRRKKGLA